MDYTPEAETNDEIASELEGLGIGKFRFAQSMIETSALLGRYLALETQAGLWAPEAMLRWLRQSPQSEDTKCQSLARLLEREIVNCNIQLYELHFGLSDPTHTGVNILLACRQRVEEAIRTNRWYDQPPA